MIETAATLEFHSDATFKAVDDMEMAVSGKYTLSDDGHIRFEITHPGTSPEIIHGKLTVKGDELTFISNNNREVERYKREK